MMLESTVRRAASTFGLFEWYSALLSETTRQILVAHLQLTPFDRRNVS